MAALCYRREGIETEVLLVTSRGRGRWILPKGWPMDGLDDAHAAAQEAWEEAGVSGHVTGPALGSFGYVKLAEEGEATACRADVLSDLGDRPCRRLSRGRTTATQMGHL